MAPDLLSPRRKRMVATSWAAAAVLLALAAGVGCGGPPRDAAIALQGWSLTADQVARECDAVRGPGVFDTMTTARRESFARTLADREILLRMARTAKVEVAGREKRGYTVNREKALLRAFLENLRARFRPDAEQEARELPRLFRAARTEQFLVIGAERARQAADALQSGRDFGEVGREFSDVSPPPGRPPEPAVRERLVRVDDRQAPAPILREALLRDLPPGGVADPIRLPEGTAFLRVLGYEPLAEASDSLWVRRARRALANLVWVGRSKEWADSLRQAAGLTTHPETYPLIAERVEAMWDSIEGLRSEGIPFDVMTLRAPTWRFTPEELARPVYEMRGVTYTVADYLRSLDGVDVDFWPGVTSPERYREQFEARIDRLLLEDEARRRGFDKSSAFLEALRPVEERWLLEAYFAAVTAAVPEPGPDSLQAAYETYRQRLQIPEAVSFSVLSYPPSQEARARAVYKMLREGPPELLGEIGPKEVRERGAWFVPRTQRRNVALGPFRPELADFWPVALKLQPGEYSELFRTSNGHWGIVRLEERRPARDRTMAEARPFLLQKTKGAEQNRIMERILKEQRKAMGLEVRPEVLAEWRRPAPEAD